LARPESWPPLEIGKVVDEGSFSREKVFGVGVVVKGRLSGMGIFRAVAFTVGRHPALWLIPRRGCRSGEVVRQGRFPRAGEIVG